MLGNTVRTRMRKPWQSCFTYGCILMLFIQACNPYKNQHIDQEKVKFTTSDASELFFKNVRQSYYNKFEMKEAKLDILRIKDRVESTDNPVINLAIVINWRFDEAYILTEPSPFFDNIDTLKINWEDTIHHTSGQLLLTKGNKAEQFEFAAGLYNHLLAKHQMYAVNAENRPVSFLHNPGERDAFRKTMFDYMRLVDLF